MRQHFRGAKRARTFPFLVTLVVGAALLGCTPSTFVVQGYKGTVQPAEKLAILRVNGADAVQLLQVDAEAADVPVSRDTRLHIELLPGEHEIVLLNRGDGGFADPVSFVAEAGHVYRPGFARLGEPGASEEARVYEVDADSDAIRRDVSKRSPREPALTTSPERAPPKPSANPAP